MMIDLEQARRSLQAMRDDYTRRITALKKDIHHVEEPVEKDFAEQATQMENQQVLEALDDEARQQVGLIDAALARIEDDSYGRCSSCGEAISAQRLQAIPFATLCIDCAEDNS